MTRALVLIVALVACQYSQNRYAHREIKSDELVGAWIVTPQGLKDLAAVGVKTHLAREDHVLLLRADRTCVIRTEFGLPGQAHDYREYASGCTWRLGSVGYQALQFHLSPEPNGGSPYFYFAEEDGHLLIWQYADDPDAWRYLEFERTDNAQGSEAC